MHDAGNSTDWVVNTLQFFRRNLFIIRCANRLAWNPKDYQDC